MDEIERIKQAYEKRDLSDKDKIYSLSNPSALFLFHQREKAILEALSKCGMNDLPNKRILDVGCGKGGVLRDFIKYGATTQNLHGIDLLPDRIEEAKRISPNIDFRCSDAEELPYADENFDIVLSFTVFTSIFDRSMKKNITKEMLRILKPEGIILWYDYFISKPTNPDVKGVGKKEIKKLFRGCKFDFKKVTLAPPIARRLAPISWLTCYLLEKIPLLRTHYLVVIKKTE